MGRGDLSDAEWERLRPFLPISNGRCGRWRNHRQVIDGILHRVTMVSDADQWRGSRSDRPGAFLACLRYPEDDSPASEDIVRYRAFLRSLGLEPVI